MLLSFYSKKTVIQPDFKNNINDKNCLYLILTTIVDPRTVRVKLFVVAADP